MDEMKKTPDKEKSEAVELNLDEIKDITGGGKHADTTTCPHCGQKTSRFKSICEHCREPI